MFTNPCSSSSLVALSLLLLPASARVLWMPEEFDPSTVDEKYLLRRDAAKCGGDSSLTYCGGGMPSGFCCSGGYTCLEISTNTSVQAAMCCPNGSECKLINPVSCDMSLQNTTITQLHANPPQKLTTCGSACCPMGYSCRNSQCLADETPTAPSSATTPPSTTTTSTHSSPTDSSSASSATSSPTSAAQGGTVALHQPNSNTSSSHFSGASFAAGFVPGIALGALIAACIILIVLHKKRSGGSKSYVDEKRKARDTLTDLGPLQRRPTTHGRNISEPKADPSTGYRTDFLRSTPPREVDGAGAIANGYVVNMRTPATPSDSPPRVRALFSRSPFMSQYPSTPPSTQAPIPAHMKRGTLSFKISPVRALRKQKSHHSLRRQITDASLGQDNVRSDSRRKVRPDLSRSGSTETIQVLMPSNDPYTPERPTQMPDHIQTLASVAYQPSSSTSSDWTATDTTSDSSLRDDRHKPEVTYASSSRYPSEIPQLYNTPTRPSVPRIPQAFETTLGSPYTPTNRTVIGKGRATAGGGLAPGGGLGVQREDSRRDTTFSAMMERAGLSKSDLLMGGGAGKKR